MALTSCTTCDRASSSWSGRARREKSPSRSAERRLARVWSGRTTRSRSLSASHPQKTTTNRVTVQRSLRLWASYQTKISERTAPGRPVPSARRRTRSSKARAARRGRRNRPRKATRRLRARAAGAGCGAAGFASSEAMLLQPAVEGAARQPQRLRRLADVAVAGERLLDEHLLHV